MRRVILILVCLLAFDMYSNGKVVIDKGFNSFLLCENGDWERLGEISAVSQYGKIESFGLYVKFINGREYYHVRRSKIYRIGEPIPQYSVSIGNYVFKGVNYNAKFSVNSTTYYFNI